MVPSFNENSLENLSRIMGEEITGTQLSNILEITGIQDTSGESTKWRRIYRSLLDRQRRDRCGNHVAAFIQAVMSPRRFINESEKFENARRELNAILSFDGLEIDSGGIFKKVSATQTITEAEKRAGVLNSKLHGRRIHSEVLKYCRAELLQNNYFHAVFEATKGLAQRIREKTGLKGDGNSLIDETFSIKRPRIAFNKLQTETDHSEHTGFAMLLKGCFSAIRNPHAHEPKILWDGEDDAADYLTLVSLLHRKLDESFVVPYADGL